MLRNWKKFTLFGFIAVALTLYSFTENNSQEQSPFVSHSFCSSRSASRGPGQRVLSYSYYENAYTSRNQGRDYLSGVARNLPTMRAHYPGYVMRVYHDIAANSTSLATLNRLAVEGGDLDLCHVGEIPALPDMSHIFPMLWRFLVGLDPQVDVFFVRDLDSPISKREESAVSEFLQSTDTDWHVMRDHPDHCVAILGCSWGVKLQRPSTRKLYRESFYKSMNDTSLSYAPRTSYQPDQRILTKYFWPWAKDTMMAHDSYCCKIFRAGWRPYPTARTNEAPNFIGAASLKATIPKGNECPQDCRPANHQDWVYC